MNITISLYQLFVFCGIPLYIISAIGVFQFLGALNPFGGGRDDGFNPPLYIAVWILTAIWTIIFVIKGIFF